MKYALLLSLLLLPIMVCAAPVHVTLNTAASVTADADGFWTLAQAATLTGGTKDVQARLASVVVGRVPLPGETRTITRGDVLLKLRQAGLCPGIDAVVDGVGQVTVTAPPAPNNGKVRNNTFSSPSLLPIIGAGGPLPGLLVHSGDPVAIVVQDGAISITARGEAREAGAKGKSIRVHREGVMTDLRATVIDPQTVRLEI